VHLWAFCDGEAQQHFGPQPEPQQHRNGIKKAQKVPLCFPKGMNSKFLRNVKHAKEGLAKKNAKYKK
jgi:hypothetical protein